MSHYLIHVHGKVASQTLEASIRTLRPDAVVERHHVISDRGLEQRARAMSLPGADNDLPLGNADQLRTALAFRQQWPQWPADAWVIFGTRAPLALVLSHIFQNARQAFPWASFEADSVDEEAERAVSDIYGFLDKIISGETPKTFLDYWHWLKLRPLDGWIKDEILDFHGVDLFRHEIGDRPFINFQHGKRRFLIYRYEELRDSLPEILAALELPHDRTTSVNIGAAKSTGSLYRAVKGRFSPTQQTLDFYNAQRYVEHFYSGDNARHLGVRALKDQRPIETSDQQAISLSAHSDPAKAAWLETELRSAQESLARERTLTTELNNRLLQLQVGVDEISSTAAKLANANKQIQADLNESERQRLSQNEIFNGVLEKAQDRLVVEIKQRDRIIDEAHAALNAVNVELANAHAQLALEVRQAQSDAEAHRAQVLDLNSLIAEAAQANLRLEEELRVIHAALHRSRYLQFKRWLGRLAGR